MRLSFVLAFSRYQPGAMFGSFNFYETAIFSVSAAVMAFVVGWSLATVATTLRGNSDAGSTSRSQVVVACLVLVIAVGYFPVEYWRMAGTVKDLSMQHIRYTESGWSGFTLHASYHYDADSSLDAIASLILPERDSKAPRATTAEQTADKRLSIQFESAHPTLVTSMHHEIYVLVDGRWVPYKRPVTKKAVWQFMSSPRAAYSLEDLQKFIEKTEE